MFEEAIEPVVQGMSEEERFLLDMQGCKHFHVTAAGHVSNDRERHLTGSHVQPGVQTCCWTERFRSVSFAHVKRPYKNTLTTNHLARCLRLTKT